MKRNVYSSEIDDGWDKWESPLTETNDHGDLNQNDAESSLGDASEASSNPAHSVVNTAFKCLGLSFLSVILLFCVTVFSLTDFEKSDPDLFTIENAQFPEQDIIAGLFGLFGPSRPSHEVTLDLSLEELYEGYRTDYPLEFVQTCPSCGGHGRHLQPCPICGGRGFIHSFRGMTTCNHCHGQGHLHSEMCSYCHGQGSVRRDYTVPLVVQPGAVDGSGRVYTLSDGSKVLFKIHQKPHNVFTRKGKDLHMTMSISLKEALLGTTRSVKILSGKVVEVKIPAGVQPFEEIRIRGCGFIRDSQKLKDKLLSRLQFNKGDLVVTVMIDFPTVLSKSQREIIMNVFLTVC